MLTTQLTTAKGDTFTVGELKQLLNLYHDDCKIELGVVLDNSGGKPVSFNAKSVQHIARGNLEPVALRITMG